VADHSGWKPGEVKVSASFDELYQAVADDGGFRPAQNILRMDSSGVGQSVPCAGLEVINRSLRIEVLKARLAKRDSVLLIHGSPVAAYGR
jgi:hypothetical protein